MGHQRNKLATAKRDIIVAFRLTAEEAAHIDEAAAGLKRPRARGDFCRAAALYAARHRVPEPVKPPRLPPRRKPTLDIHLLSKTLAELGKLGASVNAIARTANTGDPIPTAMTLTAASREIASISAAVANVLRGGTADEVAP